MRLTVRRISACPVLPCVVLPCPLLWNPKPIDGCNAVAKPLCDPCNICACRSPAIDLVLQILNLRIGNSALEHTIQIVICAVVVNGICPQVAVFIHIPFRHICVRIQAITDVPGFNHLISLRPTIPEPKITNNKDRL